MAFRPCPSGRQVFLSYGPLPNAKLLLFYGFAMDGNPFDTVALPAEVWISRQGGGEDSNIVVAFAVLQSLPFPLPHHSPTPALTRCSQASPRVQPPPIPLCLPLSLPIPPCPPSPRSPSPPTRVFSGISTSAPTQALLRLAGLDLAEQRLREAAGPPPQQLRACLRLAAASGAEVQRLRKVKKNTQLLKELMVSRVAGWGGGLDSFHRFGERGAQGKGVLATGAEVEKNPSQDSIMPPMLPLTSYAQPRVYSYHLSPLSHSLGRHRIP